MNAHELATFLIDPATDVADVSDVDTVVSLARAYLGCEQALIQCERERDAALDRAEAAARERDEAVAVLRMVEWCDSNDWACPCCYRRKTFGHLSDCALSAVLGKRNITGSEK